MAGRADFDIYNVLLGLGRAREATQVARATLDPRFLFRLRRTLLPLPYIDRPRPIDTSDLFPPLQSKPIPALGGKRVGFIAGGGSGGCVSLIGVKRAFEEAGIEPVAISSCSGGTLWGSMWAAGMTAQEMAEFSLSWELEHYMDIQWHKVPGFIAKGFKGFRGLTKGEAIERTFNERFEGVTAGELPIPLTSIVYDLDRGGVEYFGPATHPELTVGELVRIAIALPLIMEAVRVDGHLYVDGGVVDLLPARPLVDLGDQIDHVICANVMLPPQLQPADLTGWEDKLMGILEAARQAEQAFQLELARRTRDDFAGRFTMIDACDHQLLRGPSFFDLFLDRSRWPELVQEGYARATAELDALRAAPAASANAAATPRATGLPAKSAAKRSAKKAAAKKRAAKPAAKKAAAKRSAATSAKPAAATPKKRAAAKKAAATQ